MVEKDKNFKDTRGVQKTESLFIETIQPQPAKTYEPLYSLRDYDHKGYPSAYQIYMDSIDERDAAIKLVGSMAHWRKLCSLKWFMDGRLEAGFEGIDVWRSDMAARDATEAKRVLLMQCKDDNVPAARALDALSVKAKKAVPKRAKKVSSSDSTVTDFLKQQQGR